MKGVVYENDRYRVTDTPFYKTCEEVLGIVVENKAKFGSTIKRGEAVLDRYLESLKEVSGRYVILEFGGNDCDFNWKEVSEDPEADHLPMSTVQDFNSMYSYMIEKIKELGKIPALLSLPPIDSERYFRHISRDLSAENIDGTAPGAICAADARAHLAAHGLNLARSDIEALQGFPAMLFR